MPEVSVSFTVDSHDLDEDGLLDILNEHFQELEEYLLTGGISHLNTRAEYSDETLELLDVEDFEEGHAYSLHYQFGWEAWHGCKDMNDGGIEDEWARFSYKDGRILFKKLVEERDTIDEF